MLTIPKTRPPENVKQDDYVSAFCCRLIVSNETVIMHPGTRAWKSFVHYREVRAAEENETHVHSDKSPGPLSFISTQPKHTCLKARCCCNCDGLDFQLTWAKEGEVGASLVAHRSVRRFPASYEFKDRLGVSKRVVLVAEWVVEHLKYCRYKMELNHLVSSPQPSAWWWAWRWEQCWSRRRRKLPPGLRSGCSLRWPRQAALPPAQDSDPSPSWGEEFP